MSLSHQELFDPHMERDRVSPHSQETQQKRLTADEKPSSMMSDGFWFSLKKIQNQLTTMYGQSVWINNNAVCNLVWLSRK